MIQLLLRDRVTTSVDFWTTKRHELMLQIVKTKFHQNLELADELRDTGKKTSLSLETSILCKRISNHSQRHIRYESVDCSKLGDILMTVLREFPPKADV